MQFVLRVCPTLNRVFGPLVVLVLVAVAPGCGSEAEPGTSDAGPTPDAANDISEDLADEEIDPDSCEPGSRVCASALSYAVCSEVGTFAEQIQCDGDLACLEGECVPTICEPFEVRGCSDSFSLDACNFSGTAWVAEECPAFWTCAGGACVEPPCVPGTHQCEGIDTILTCNPETGEFIPMEECEAGFGCFEDTCQPLCEINEKLRSYVGCEYWSVDLDNLSDAESIEHTVVLSNPNRYPANVEVVNPMGENLELINDTVEPGDQLVIRFPSEGGLIQPGITDFSWRINTTVPVTAHQFNPLDNFTDPFTNDGTLLLPTHALGQQYWGMSWIHRESTGGDLNGFITIVAVDEAGAEVLVRPASNAQIGNGQTLAPGEEHTFDLEYGQTLTLQTTNVDDDLTGTFIESTETDLAVFGGHECANVVLGIDRCDHMETQLLPTELLRSHYVATKYEPRTPEGVLSEPDFWRIMAVEGATLIETDPEIPGIHGEIIASGEWLQVEYRDHFVISADRPISVSHYMVSANWTQIPRDCFDNTGPPTGIGDPAMTQLIPVEQYRADYLVLTPFAYVEDYLNLAVRSSAIDSVTLDGVAVDSSLFVPIADGTWSVARLRVTDGPHEVKASSAFGLDAYGYSCHVSYAYPGGLNLEVIE